MFGVSLPDMAIIAFVAVLMFGPERMPELARSAARLIKNLRQLAAKTQDDLRRELGPEFADLRLTDLNPREAIRRHVLDGLDFDMGSGGGANNQTTDAVDTLGADERPPFDVDAT